MRTPTLTLRTIVLALTATALVGGISSTSLAAPEADMAQGENYIVKFRPQSAAMSSATARSAALRETAATNGTFTEVRELAIGAHLVKLTGRNPDGALKALKARSDVEYVERDVQMYAVATPNDTRYAEQWHYFEATAGLNLPTAWDTADGTGVTVAVIDTGRTVHSDLDGNTVAGYDFISDSAGARDGNGRDSNPQDEGDWNATNGECGTGSTAHNSSWHGTHVAGTIAAVSNNGSGVAGVAPKAKVQHVRVLGKCGGSLSDIADAIIWASGGTVTGIPANSTPAKVINMSLGGVGACGSTYQNAINGAVGRGTVVVVAAGNSNENASNHRPANCSNVITVAGLDREGNRAVFRSDGSAASNFGTVVDVAAPGGETWTATDRSNGILSTLNSGTTTPGSASYAFYQGTSMATPHVAGVAALMLGEKSLTPAEVESTMKANVRAIPGTCSGGCGAGLVDTAKTIAALSGGGGGGATQLLKNPGFESGNADWSASSGVIDSSTSTYTARTGSWKAWMCGYGSSHTDTLSQSVAIASTAASATLKFWLRIDSAESGTTAYDTLKVQILNSAGTVLATLATYSNANENTAYQERSFDLSAYKGSTITIKFLAAEDSSLQTSFLVDDTSVNVA